jgi:hypothetical protein
MLGYNTGKGLARANESMKMEKTESSETSAYNIQTAGNYPEESIQLLKSSNLILSHFEGGNLEYKSLANGVWMKYLD